MTRRREYPLNLQISLESLPPPESRKREQAVVLRFTNEDLARIERAARERGEPPAVLCRTIILTAFQDSALRDSRSAATSSPGGLRLRQSAPRPPCQPRALAPTAPGSQAEPASDRPF